MNKEQSINYFINCGYDENDWEFADRIDELSLYDDDEDGFILFEDFIKYYYDLNNKYLNLVWHDLKKLGYNKYLNENYDLDNLLNNKEDLKNQ